MKTLLLTGAGGFLGWNVCLAVNGRWRVYGTLHENGVVPEKCTPVRVDLTNFRDVTRILKEIRPYGVIHCAAISKPDSCETNPNDAYKINVGATSVLASLCEELGVRFVFASSDNVFDGTSPPYSESASVCPINKYGEQKVKAEKEVLRRHLGALVCRLPLMFGVPSPVSQCFMQTIIASLKKSKNISLYADEFRTPASARRVAEGLLLGLEGYSGIMHLGGHERISRYEFGVKCAHVWGYDTSLIRAIAQRDIITSAPRPKDLSLDSSLAFSRGYAPLTILEELRLMKKQ
ncbi:MAG: dTDP-4-dehydrorhamnose reductase [Parcubacteria group bacterium LiPW_30]|nr:MAG: dTDP-4-dehydrorhamnose reductase [Parcubacteria group bacterium LiPW_30]